MWSKYFSDAIAESFAQAQKRRNISLRGFAKLVGAPSGMVSEIIRAKRVISFSRAMEICEKAQISPETVAKIKRSYEEQKIRKNRTVLPATIVEIILNADYYRFLCALEILPKPATFAEVADFLDVKIDLLKGLSATLAELDIIAVEDSKITWKGDYLATPENLTSQKIRAYHKKTIEDSVQGLELPLEDREITSVIFAGRKDQMEDAKAVLRNVRDTISETMGGAIDPDTVYQLSVQLRPISKSFERGNFK